MSKTNKTSQVMRLITGGNVQKPQEKENRGGDRKKRVIRKDETEKFMPPVPQNPSLRIESGGFESKLVHVPTELLREQLFRTLERFNVCNCDICVAIITEKIIAELPNRFVKLNSVEDENELKAELDRMRPEVLKKLAKMCISAKRQPLHNK